MRKLISLMVCATVIGVGSAGDVQASATLFPMISSSTVTSPDLRFRCGNITGDEEGRVNLADIFALVAYVYLDGDPPPAREMANVNGSPDGKVNLADIGRLVSYVYLGGPDPACGCCIHKDVNSTCVGIQYGGILDEGGMYIETAGRDMFVYRWGADYQCCLEYAVHWELESNLLTGVESDTGMPCDCYCAHILVSTVYDLADGEYIVTLIGVYGGLIGTDTVTIGGPGLISYEFSDCLEQPIPSLVEDIEYNYSGDTLAMAHHNAYYNCGAEVGGFAIHFTRAGDTLRFRELNMMETGMYCMCHYELGGTVAGIPPGTYVAEIWGSDGPLVGEYLELLDRRVLQLGP